MENLESMCLKAKSEAELGGWLDQEIKYQRDCVKVLRKEDPRYRFSTRKTGKLSNAEKKENITQLLPVCRLRPEGGTGCRWDSGEDWVKSIIFPVMMSVQTKKENSKGPWTCPLPRMPCTCIFYCLFYSFLYCLLYYFIIICLHCRQYKSAQHFLQFNLKE